MEGVLCDSCNKQIAERKDLVIAAKYFFLNLKKYHRRCYADIAKMKTLTSGFVGSPINSLQRTIILAVSSVIIWGLGLLLFQLLIDTPIIASILALVFFIAPLPGILTRLLAYFRYERRLSD